MSLTSCRFFENKYPEIDSFVMVNVKQVRKTVWDRERSVDCHTRHATLDLTPV